PALYAPVATSDTHSSGSDADQSSVEEVERSYRRGYKKSITLRSRAWKHTVPLGERSGRSAQAGQHTDSLRAPTLDKQHLTGKDVLLQLCLLIKDLQGSQGPHMVHCFLNATLSPPITSESLSELDMVRIVNNPKLRHDINFDRELSFRPNLEGPNRKEKFRATDEYWTALTAELALYTHLFDASSSARRVQEQHRGLYIAGSRKRVPLLFETLKDILKTLVAEGDQSRIEEVLDVPMLMQ
ncbi:Protein SOSEKI 1, partial [Cryomyces antarcticus]